MEERTTEEGQATSDQTEATSARIARLESEVTSLTEEVNRAQESERTVRADCLYQTQQAKEAHEKYERELMQRKSILVLFSTFISCSFPFFFLDAVDVEKLNLMREQGEQIRARLAIVEETLARAEEELSNGRQSDGKLE